MKKGTSKSQKWFIFCYLVFRRSQANSAPWLSQSPKVYNFERFASPKVYCLQIPKSTIYWSNRLFSPHSAVPHMWNVGHLFHVQINDANMVLPYHHIPLLLWQLRYIHRLYFYFLNTELREEHIAAYHNPPNVWSFLSNTMACSASALIFFSTLRALVSLVLTSTLYLISVVSQGPGGAQRAVVCLVVQWYGSA